MKRAVPVTESQPLGEGSASAAHPAPSLHADVEAAERGTALDATADPCYASSPSFADAKASVHEDYRVLVRILYVEAGVSPVAATVGRDG